MTPAAIVIHGLAHARHALAAAAALRAPVTLISAEGAAAYAGAGWFRAVVAEARAERPGVPVTAILDCGSEPGLVLGALREGLTCLRYSGPAEVTAKLEAIARAAGAVILAHRPPSLDLLDARDPETACRQWLAFATQDDDA